MIESLPKTKNSLNEGFAVVLSGQNNKPELLFVNGKQIDEKYAIVYNHESDFYTITYIESGARVSNNFKRLEDCVQCADGQIKKADELMKEKRYENRVKESILLFNKLMKEYANGRSET